MILAPAVSAILSTLYNHCFTRYPNKFNVNTKTSRAIYVFFSEGFTHLKIYEISYMWNAAISCMFTFVVGALVSLAYKPQNPKTLNPDLISPALPHLFSAWPKKVQDFIKNLEIGSEYVSLFFNDVEITNSSLFNCFNNYVSKFCFQSLVH